MKKQHKNTSITSIFVINFMSFILIIFVSSWASYYSSQPKDIISDSPFTTHYHFFKDKNPPLKIFLYNRSFPVFDQYWKNLFSKNQTFWKHSSTPYFVNHTYAIDTAILEKIINGPFVEKDGAKADLYFYKFIGSPFRGAIRLKHIVADCKAQGPYYERSGGIDHFFIQTIQHTLGECIINPEDHMQVHNMFSIQSVEWQDSEVHPRYFERVTIIPVHSNLNLKRNTGAFHFLKGENKRTLNVYLIASFDTYVNETNYIRMRMFDALRSLPDSAIINFSRKMPRIFSRVHKNIENMGKSNICVIPPGDSPTSKRFFDSLNSLCIPYIFSDAIRFPFESVFIDYEKFILMHRMKKLEGIRNDIMLINSGKIKKIREIIRKALPLINDEFGEPYQLNHYSWAWFWFQYIQACSIASVKYRFPYNLYDNVTL